MNTACTSDEIAHAKVFLQNKHSTRQLLLDECYGRAVDDFNRMVKFIIETYNPKRIWQWGSLLNRKHFSEISDIDIALEGLDSFETYAAILADLSAMTAFPVDLVEMERIGMANADHIRAFGRMVYERPED